MAVATKAAAFGVLLRLFDVALIADHASWGPALAGLAVVTIVVGNVGALGQSSLKRMLAYSSVAQAGYMLAGLAVATQLGVRATVLYLVTYLLMNVAAFAVIVARERETPLGDDIDSLAGLGSERPVLAWSMTIAMLSLAGNPGDGGVHRQGLPDPGGSRRQLRLARRGDRARVRRLAGLLPAGGRDDLDAQRAITRQARLARRSPAASPEAPVVPAPARGRHAEVAIVAIAGAGAQPVLRDHPPAPVRPRARGRERPDERDVGSRRATAAGPVDSWIQGLSQPRHGAKLAPAAGAARPRPDDQRGRRQNVGRGVRSRRPQLHRDRP